jgi:hypothetical protein
MQVGGVGAECHYKLVRNWPRRRGQGGQERNAVRRDPAERASGTGDDNATASGAFSNRARRFRRLIVRSRKTERFLGSSGRIRTYHTPPEDEALTAAYSQIHSHKIRPGFEICEVIRAWADLPEALRAAVLAIVRSHATVSAKTNEGDR